jgi:hypothetical protein
MTPVELQAARETLYLLSPSAWARRELKIVLDGWQSQMVDAPAGRRVIALVHRQAGKTTAGAVGVAHTMTRRLPSSTNLVLAPTQRQSAELILKVRTALLDSGERLAVDNAYSVALDNGSRCLGLPGADDASIRGLSIDGDLVVDEAARVSDGLFEAAKPMTIRHGATSRLVLLSTAWAKSGFFYSVWTMGDPQDWTKIEAKVAECQHISAADLDRERRSMSAAAFGREYENQFDSVERRFFDQAAIAGAFGDDGLSPPPPDGDPDPIVGVEPAFRKFA